MESSSAFANPDLLGVLEHELRISFDVMAKAQMFGDRRAVHVAIVAPGLPYDEGFVDPIVFSERIIAPSGNYTAKYETIARAKALMSWRERMDTRLIVAKPHLLRVGDVKYAGGVYVCDTAVGVSGLRSQDDEFLARWIAARLAALAITASEELFSEDPDRYLL